MLNNVSILGTTYLYYSRWPEYHLFTEFHFAGTFNATVLGLLRTNEYSRILVLKCQTYVFMGKQLCETAQLIDEDFMNIFH